MHLKSNEVMLLWLPTEGIQPQQWLRLFLMLDQNECRRARRFQFANDRLVYIAAHALLRGALAALTGRPGREWTFYASDYGKPEAVCHPGEPIIRVNLSHTNGLAAVALVLDYDVGVDVEWTGRSAPLDVASSYFAADERALLCSLSSAEAKETFFTFWTLKEAYLKATGAGLSLPLDSVVFAIDPPALLFTPRDDDCPGDWLFQRLRPSPEHLLALAVRHPSPEHLQVTTHLASVSWLTNLPS